MIRPATPGDRAAIEAIVRDAFTPWIEVIGARPMPMMADYAALIGAGHVHVLESTDVPDIVTGLIVLVPEPDAGTLVVDNLAVRQAAQHRGHGRHLLAFAEERARVLGFPALRIYTHAKMTANITLYRALGYRETGRDSIGDRQVVYLRKDLPAPYPS